MPQTPVYGLPFEAPGDLPGHTLDGGPVGAEPILAEAVEAELSRIDSDVADLQAEVARGWIPIGSGEELSNFTIDLTAGGKFPAGTFSLIRVYLRGSLTVDGVRIQVRVNGDTTPELHLRSWMVHRMDTGALVESGADAVTSWPVGLWSTGASCNSRITIYRTDVSSILSFDAVGYRASSGNTLRYRMQSNGHLAAARLLSSLQVFPFTGSIARCFWWAEGFRV